MKKLFIVGLLFLSSCTCAAEKNAVVQIEATYALIEFEYLKYIDADPKLDAAAKDDRKQLIDKYHHILDALKKSLK